MVMSPKYLPLLLERKSSPCQLLYVKCIVAALLKYKIKALNAKISKVTLMTQFVICEICIFTPSCHGEIDMGKIIF